MSPLKKVAVLACVILLATGCQQKVDIGVSGQGSTGESTAADSIAEDAVKTDTENDLLIADTEKSSEVKPEAAGQPVTEDAVVKYLEQQVPEVQQYLKMMEDYNVREGTPYRGFLRVDSVPDPKAEDVFQRDYYGVYVGENREDHTSRWYTFLVRKDMKEIRVDDVVSGTYISLEEWRQFLKQEAENRQE